MKARPRSCWSFTAQLSSPGASDCATIREARRGGRIGAADVAGADAVFMRGLSGWWGLTPAYWCVSASLRQCPANHRPKGSAPLELQGPEAKAPGDIGRGYKRWDR